MASSPWSVSHQVLQKWDYYPVLHWTHFSVNQPEVSWGAGSNRLQKYFLSKQAGSTNSPPTSRHLQAAKAGIWNSWFTILNQSSVHYNVQTSIYFMQHWMEISHHITDGYINEERLVDQLKPVGKRYLRPIRIAARNQKSFTNFFGKICFPIVLPGNWVKD